ncbi:MAG: NADH-quinone oxidoreductase subunit J [Verrucomicrobiota bacterium]
MAPHDLLFFLFAGLTLLFAFLVVANPFSRSPVASAMFLVMTIVSMAGLFALLHAFFLAAVQILVYAGAVMVLFLFIIMLLDLPAEEQRKNQMYGLVSGIVAVLGLAGILIKTIWFAEPIKATQPAIEGGTKALGAMLFNYQLKSPGFLLPFEIVSLILLVAMVGVILLSKKDLK